MSNGHVFWLMPERPKSRGGMADVVAQLDGVQLQVDYHTDGLVLRAEQLLRQHTDTGVAHIEKARGRADGYAVLVDSNITNAEDADTNSALSIEFGREGWTNDKGQEVGGMSGLNILGRAAALSIKGKKVRAKKPTTAAQRRRKKLSNRSIIRGGT